MIDKENDKEKTSPFSSVGAFLRSSLRRSAKLNDSIRRSLRSQHGKPFIPRKNSEICYDFVEYDDDREQNDGGGIATVKPFQRQFGTPKPPHRLVRTRVSIRGV